MTSLSVPEEKEERKVEREKEREIKRKKEGKISIE